MGEKLAPPYYDLVDASLSADRDLTRSEAILDTLAWPAFRWSELTGQRQGWGMFAPGASPQIALHRIHLHWDGPPAREIVLRSDFEPDDPTHFLRLPGTNLRLFNYEWRLAGVMVFYRAPNYSPDPEMWRKFFAAAVRSRNGVLQAYLRYRLQQFAREHPELPPPDEVVFSIWVERLPMPPESGGSVVFEQPLARWRPQAPPRADALPIEVFDVIEQQFRPVPRLPD
jgi:hypothetical protein